MKSKVAGGAKCGTDDFLCNDCYGAGRSMKIWDKIARSILGTHEEGFLVPPRLSPTSASD